MGKSKLSNKIEEVEYRYFTSIKTQMLSRVNSILKFLNSRIDIINDWRNQFLQTSRRGYRQSDLDKGAERIFHNMIIKTALLENTSDYKGVINISKNQTSYSIPNNDLHNSSDTRAFF